MSYSGSPGANGVSYRGLATEVASLPPLSLFAGHAGSALTGDGGGEKRKENGLGEEEEEKKAEFRRLCRSASQPQLLLSPAMIAWPIR